MQELFLLKIKPVRVFNFVKLLKNKSIFQKTSIKQNIPPNVKIFFPQKAIWGNEKISLKSSTATGSRIFDKCFSDHVLQPRGHTPGKPRRGSPLIPRVTAYPGRAELRLYLKKISWCRKLQEK